MTAFPLNDRQRRWLDALLILATIAVGLIVLGAVGEIFFYFGDIILVFFLAWLLAFILSPLVSFIDRTLPGLPRIVAVVIVYVVLLGLFVLLALVVANALAGSIREFVRGLPTFREQLPTVLSPWQDTLNTIGFAQIDLVQQATLFLDNLGSYANELVVPLQQLAVASLGAVGNLLLVLILSLYMVADRDRILAFFFRVVPPARKEEARLLETSIARSFGGFLRGQAIMGVVYGAVALVANAAGNLDLDYAPITSLAAGGLMAIPFFGPFISWSPPVLVAILTAPDSIPIVLGIMIVGWFVVMNVLQPRLMEEAVGIHPIVVLGSVLIGSKVAGITGAIFGIPIAAVLSAFFFHYLGRSHDTGPIAVRAARRLEEREGRPVRVPREPNPAIDPDVDDAAAQGPRLSDGLRRRPTEPSMQAHPADAALPPTTPPSPTPTE